MPKSKAILFTPEERSKQLDPIMREVKKQVMRYKAAKKSVNCVNARRPYCLMSKI